MRGAYISLERLGYHSSALVLQYREILGVRLACWYRHRVQLVRFLCYRFVEEALIKKEDRKAGPASAVSVLLFVVLFYLHAFLD